MPLQGPERGHVPGEDHIRRRARAFRKFDPCGLFGLLEGGDEVCRLCVLTVVKRDRVEPLPGVRRRARAAGSERQRDQDDGDSYEQATAPM